MKPKVIKIKLDRESDQISIQLPEGETVRENTGWGRAMTGPDTYGDEWHFCIEGTSICGSVMSMWNRFDHKLSDPKNCPDCVKIIRGVVESKASNP